MGRRLTPLRAYWAALVRVSLGAFFCISGGTKLLDSGARQEMVQTLTASGISLPELNALFVSLVEFAGGGLLAVGLLTPICAVLLGGDMLVAIATNRLSSVRGDSLLAWLGNFLYLPEVLFALMLGWILFSGPGKPSLDSILLPSEADVDPERPHED